ncbi:MAG TPA: hypothetical protein VM658_09350 [bacterium]|nr:hypothetical protein [bacterium]
MAEPNQDSPADPGRQGPGPIAGQDLGGPEGGLGFKFRHAVAAACLIFVVHLTLLLHFFGGPGKLISTDPLIRVDHGWHFYYSVIGSRFMEEHGSTWGYDPYLMAGCPTDVLDTTDRLIKVGLVALRSLSPEAGYKIIVFVTAAIAPLLFFLAAAWFGLRPREVIWSGLIGTWVWWTGGGILMYATGMVGFVLATLYGIAFAALFSRVLARPSPRWWLGLTLAAPFTIFIHPGILPIVGVPCAVLYLGRFRKMAVREHLLVAAAAGMAVILNLFWILPMRFNLASATLYHPFFMDPLFYIWLLVEISFRRGQIILPLLIVAGALGLRHVYAPRLELRRVIAASVLAMGIIGFLGPVIPILVHIEPVHYVLPFLFYLVFPAAITLDRWMSGPIKGRRRRPWGNMLPAALLAASLIAFLAITFSRPVEPPFVGMSEQIKSIISFLSSTTGRDSRVLLEDNGPLFETYDGSYAAATIAYYSRRELIGGPHWAAYLKAHYADLSGLMLFQRPVSSWDEKPLREMMDRYNIGWAGARSPLIQDMFNQYPGLFRRAGEAGGFRFYKVNRAPTFFVEGTGLATADYNRISLRNVRAPTGRAVISYHWHPRLVADPPAKLAPVMLGEDPVGFIGIIDPPPALEITVRYW